MKRQRIEGIDVLLSRELESRGFLAAFTERESGVSASPYASLNLGAGTGDAAAAVATNRARVATALRIPPPLTVRQVHGDHVVTASAPGAKLGQADAITTPARGVPLAIMVADCVPLAIASSDEGRITVVHVGWRGLAAGVVRRALDTFAAPSALVAAIGPAIGPCHYQVGGEVIEAVNTGTGGLARTRENGSLFLDLPGTVQAVLEDGSVPVIENVALCTHCHQDRFFSHRRDGRTGRQALVAMRL